MVMMTFGVLPQILKTLLNVDLYLSYLVGLPTIVAVLVSGGVGRCLRTRTGLYWTAFGCWMLLAIPFSSWPGGSFGPSVNYWKINLVMMFITGGMLIEWGDIRKLLYVLAGAGVLDLIATGLLKDNSTDRFGLTAAMTISNPNDYAAHMVLMLPFLLWVVLSGKVILRVAALVCMGMGLYLILATSSRGALLALGVDALVFMLLGTGRQRLAVLLLGPTVAVVLVACVPAASLRRLGEVFTGSATSTEAIEARGSSEARQYLLTTAIKYTFEHPIFGVGPFQFASFEGGHEHVTGSHGYWHDTHNSYLQVSSECGIPALLLFAGGIGSTLLLMFKTYRRARHRPDCQDIRVAIFCIILAMTGFTVAITFLSMAYHFYLPTMAGLAIGIWSAAQRELEARDEILLAKAA